MAKLKTEEDYKQQRSWMQQYHKHKAFKQKDYPVSTFQYTFRFYIRFF